MPCDAPGLVLPALQRGDLGVHVGEDGGDGLLLRERRNRIGAALTSPTTMNG